MNLAALNQKVNRVFALIAAWINFIPAFFSSTAQDVTVTWPNEDESTTTQTHPNLAKWMQSVSGAVKGEMSPTYYVDPTNGNNNNSGKITGAPLASIREAVMRVPNGASAVIAIKSGETIVIGDGAELLNTTIANKSITFTKYDGEDPYTITWKALNDGTNNYVSNYIVIKNAFVYFAYARIITPQKIDAGDGWKPYGLILCDIGSCDIALRHTVVKAVGGANLVRDGGWGSVGATDINLGVGNSCEIVIDADNKKKLLVLQRATASFAFTSGTSLKYEDGTGAAIRDMIGGIVYDADSGNPVNITSNNNLSN